MAKKITLSAEVETTPLSVTVTAAPGSAGSAVAYSSASSSVTLTNISGACDMQYKVDWGSWVEIERYQGIVLPINLAASTLYLRRVTLDGGLCNADLVIDGVPVLAAGAMKLAQLAQDSNNNTLGILGADGLHKSWITAHASEHISMGNPLRRESGGVFCDWTSEQGVLAMATANTGESISLDTSVLANGKASIKCVAGSTPSSSPVYVGRYTPTNPISLKNFKSISIPVKISNNELVANATSLLGLWLKTASGKSLRLRMDCTGVTPNGWAIFNYSRYELASTVDTGSSGGLGWGMLDVELVNAIDIVLTPTNTATNLASNSPIWIAPLVVNSKAKAIVSVRMDGNYSSQYSMLKPLFDSAGIKCSLAVVHQNIGLAQRLSYDQISEFVANESEVIHHTYSNTKLSGYANVTEWPTAASIADDINAGWDNMRANGWISGIGKIVEGYTGNYFGSASNQARQRLIQSAFNAAGVDAMCIFTNYATMNNSVGRKFSEFTPSTIRCSLVIGSTTTVSQVNAAIDQAEALGEWLVIVIHEAVADSATPTGLQMKISDFSAWIAYLKYRLSVGGIVSHTVSNAFNAAFR